MPISSDDATRVVVKLTAGKLAVFRTELTVRPKSLPLCFQVLRYRWCGRCRSGNRQTFTASALVAFCAFKKIVFRSLGEGGGRMRSRRWWPRLGLM